MRERHSRPNIATMSRSALCRDTEGENWLVAGTHHDGFHLSYRDIPSPFRLARHASQPNIWRYQSSLSSASSTVLCYFRLSRGRSSISSAIRAGSGRELVFGRNERCLRAFAQEARATTFAVTPHVPRNPGFGTTALNGVARHSPVRGRKFLSKSAQLGRVLTRVRPVMPLWECREPVWGGSSPFRGGSGGLIPRRRNMTSLPS